MWKCPICETLNNDDKCVVCGERKPEEPIRYVPPRPTPPRPTPPRPTPPRPTPPRPVPPEYPRRKSDEEKNKKGYLIIAILTAVLVVLVAVIAIVIATDDSGDSDTEIVYVTETPSEEIPTQEPNSEPTQRPTQRPVRTVTPTRTPTPTISPSEARAQKKSAYYADASEIEAYENSVQQKNLAQSEMNYESGVIYNKWDKLLNDIYKYLEQIMTTSEFDALEKDEVNWIIEKEAAADEAAAQFEGVQRRQWRGI